MDLDIVTINSRDVNEALEIVEKAVPLFPEDIWGELRYWGDVKRSYDDEFRLGERTYPFYYRETIIKLLKGRKLKNPILGITGTAMIDTVTYYDRKIGNLRSKSYIVYDTVSGNKGIIAISLFNLSGDNSPIVTGHALGHAIGLQHHTERPLYTNRIDIMHHQILEVYNRIKEPFCKECQKIAERSQH